ncbi:extracellular solute-binding protein [Thalassospira sp.]|uniref:extracellular solute-binding protein n=1 Tax=Thalassospira sp. TaxID=1912094 RepID=UPI002732E8FF|nr:extracellular solute-binding protein [Thalassospira sp.]MDP2700389.1 extracellular solute-binding protein [Thalassospira sp.]
MKKTLFAAALGLAVLAPGIASAEETTIRLHYSIPTIWANTQEKLATAFMAANPDIKVVLDGPADSYEDGTQRLLRESVAGRLPDVAYVGLNLWRVLQDRGLAQPLDPFIGDMKAFDEKGYGPAVRLGQYKDQTWALGVSASTLVMYVNPKLVEQAGGSMASFPTDFDGIIKLAHKINALSPTTDGIWIEPHDWRFQSLLGAYGGRPMTDDESNITFDNPAGIAAASLYQRFATEGGMKSYGSSEARQAFPAGTLGIMLESSSLLNRFVEGAGDKFDVTVLPMPVMAPTDKVYFPTGGSGMVMLATDPARQNAVWRYMTFVTSPAGEKIIVENTGYAPTNSILVNDDSYLGSFYAANPQSRPAHQQIARFAGPWYAYPGDEGVAVNDLIGAALVNVAEGANPETTIKTLAETVRTRLGMQ